MEQKNKMLLLRWHLPALTESSAPVGEMETLSSKEMVKYERDRGIDILGEESKGRTT